MNKVQIYIDGGNFYNLALKRIGCHERDFNFEEFVKYLAGDRELTYLGKRFYIGTVRGKNDRHETMKAVANQTHLINKLETFGWQVKTSKLRTRVETVKIDDRVSNWQKLLAMGIKTINYERSREKGIDVKLATDLFVGAMDDRFDTAIVVSSDSDLTPAFDIVRKKFNKKIEYVSFSSPALSELKIYEELKPTQTMIYNSDIQRIIPVNDLNRFKL